MKHPDKTNIRLARAAMAIFWLGSFMTISFMEAPLKFTAPNLSMAEGLQIGRIVFSTLNLCEWGFMIVILITCIIQRPQRSDEGRLIATAVLILLLETFWLLPVLDKDADRIINDQAVTGYSMHWCYIVLELVKVPVLLFIAMTGARDLVTPAQHPNNSF